MEGGGGPLYRYNYLGTNMIFMPLGGGFIAVVYLDH